MARIRVPLNNFQFGEVSPALTSSTDTKVYTNAAEQARVRIKNHKPTELKNTKKKKK